MDAVNVRELISQLLGGGPRLWNADEQVSLSRRLVA
jgi:hypothetical protein